MYLSRTIRGGYWIHIGSVPSEVLQAKALLDRSAELQQALPDPKTHIFTPIWIT